MWLSCGSAFVDLQVPRGAKLPPHHQLILVAIHFISGFRATILVPRAAPWCLDRDEHVGFDAHINLCTLSYIRIQPEEPTCDPFSKRTTRREIHFERTGGATMRRGVLYFLIFNVLLILFLVHQVWTLLELLFVDGAEDAITKDELPAMGAKFDSHQPQIIPKIIHQTYINTSIPTVWQEAQASCLALHQEPEWEYKLWTDQAALEFIAELYPEFQETFENYRYPIQRADAIRYFVLDHYGGVYIDLDDGCNRSLEPLLIYPAWVRKTVPTGVSNDAMGAAPHHPFFQRIIAELKNYDRSWILPYITVMGSTGPLFLSVLWRRYSDEGFNVGDGIDGGRIRILFPKEYNDYPWSFFTHHLGNSWHAYDVQLIFWVCSAMFVHLFLFCFTDERKTDG